MFSALRRRRGFRLIAVAALALIPASALAVPASAAPPAAAPGTIPGAWIVTLAPGAAPGSVAAEHSRKYGARVGHVYRSAVNGYSAKMSDAEAERLAQDPQVLSVERDRVVTAYDVQSTPTGIDRIDAEKSSTLAGNGVGLDVDVDVAVIDTGVDLDHPDLNVRPGKDCVTENGTADDQNGHGTHVAGTIGAKDDGAGVVGVAPGARVWAVRVLDAGGGGTWDSIICGIDWVTANADTIEVANMSLGGNGTDGTCSADALHKSICASVSAGVTYAVAAGNSHVDAKNFVPATYDEVITVSALADFNGQPGGRAKATCRRDVDDTFADFSNYGADVDLIAPGVCITSTWMGGGYETISGTSMASPHVAGAAALYKSKNTSATPAQVKSALQLAGNTKWTRTGDGDRTQEKLLNVAGF